MDYFRVRSLVGVCHQNLPVLLDPGIPSLARPFIFDTLKQGGPRRPLRATRELSLAVHRNNPVLVRFPSRGGLLARQ